MLGLPLAAPWLCPAQTDPASIATSPSTDSASSTDGAAFGSSAHASADASENADSIRSLATSAYVRRDLTDPSTHAGACSVWAYEADSSSTTASSNGPSANAGLAVGDLNRSAGPAATPDLSFAIVDCGTAALTGSLFCGDHGNLTGAPSYWDPNGASGSDGGAVIDVSSVGISPGTTLFGYSLMASDVSDGGNLGNLVDYRPANGSDASEGAGGLDPAAVNSVMFSKSSAPEPAFYGAALMGLLGVTGCALKRRMPVTSPAA